jgi:phosphoribosylamine-glycine ligase
MDGGKVVEKDIWTTTDNYLCVVTGLGKTVKQACERAYTTLKEIHTPDMIFRDDIGEKLEGQLKTLHELGYATEFEYG